MYGDRMTNVKKLQVEVFEELFILWFPEDKTSFFLNVSLKSMSVDVKTILERKIPEDFHPIWNMHIN